MPDIAPPLEFLRSLCRAIGIDPIDDPVYSVTITVRAGDIPRIVVERYPTKEELRTISDAAREACRDFGVKPEVVTLLTSGMHNDYVCVVPSDVS